MRTYSILSKDKVWSYNYEDECCEKHENIGGQPFRFTDLALAKKSLEELEDEDFEIIDNQTGKAVI